MAYFTSVYQSELPHRAISVFIYLHDRDDKSRKRYPAISTIARALNLSRSTVKRALSDLEKSGYLRKEQRWRENGGKSFNLYFLNSNPQ
ncbi:helix-turn-helix transcriptional regulator [Lacrimispora sp.]|uniref:helix-turn-helix transcriptional regulator n=1 Tax=Lacrimispora sp. TaxID=2719234 RepID=UPI0028AB7BB9|nr:helix-turn-helix domain-containing protein [Lacrimispora sp.]